MKMDITITSNPLLYHLPELEEYYKNGWITGAELVAVIPALPTTHPDSQSYYASGAFSAVYLYENGPVYSYNECDSEGRRFYVTDKEYSTLYTHVAVGQQRVTYRRAGFEDTLKDILCHPVLLFFHGCDDGHVILRFTSREEAIHYLYGLTVFEDVFKNPNIMYEN